MSHRTLFVAAGRGSVQNVLGVTHCYKTHTGETGGAFLLFEATVPPRCGAPMHCHAGDAECFYVLEGALTFADAEGERVCTAGDVCFLPARRPHAFRNDGEVAARALVIAAPGRAAEAFFTEVDAEIGTGAPEPSAVAAIAARHDLTL